MRDLHGLDAYRLTDARTISWFGTPGGRDFGAFRIPSPSDAAPLVIIAASGMGWDHVSVSRADRVPIQTELDHVFRMFFRSGETAMQLFVPSKEHVNNHEYCLHLWRPKRGGIPKPPPEMVGIGGEPVRNPADARKLRDEAVRRLERMPYADDSFARVRDEARRTASSIGRIRDRPRE